MRDSVGHPSGACEVRYGEEEHRLKPVLPKTKTAADGCRFLEFSLDARLSLLGPRFKGQIGLMERRFGWLPFARLGYLLERAN